MIIVGYDGSRDSRAAAAWALDEAARSGASIEFFYAYEWPTWAPAAATIGAPAVWPDGETDRAVRGMLDELVKDARASHPAVRVTTSVANAGAAVTLIERSTGATMIVLGSRGHSAVAGLLGSVSVAVSAQAHCPVVVVRGRPDDQAPVVVGVEDSPASHAALAYAVDQAAARGVPLRVIRAWPPVTGLWEGSPLVTRAVSAAERASFDELLAGWRAKRPEVTFEDVAVVEHPAGALTAAGATAQLLVVGTRGRGLVRGVLLGSVSQHLLRHAACTVAVVH